MCELVCWCAQQVRHDEAVAAARLCASAEVEQLRLATEKAEAHHLAVVADLRTLSSAYDQANTPQGIGRAVTRASHAHTNPALAM